MRKLATTLGLLVLACPRMASADPTGAQCVSANEHATDLRQQDKLREARDEMLSCAVPACPARVRDDCAKQIADIDASMPTIVFEVKDPQGNDRPDVQLTVDGVLAAPRLAGSALSLDPGEREVRFEAPGAAAVVKHIVVHAGEKNRPILVVLGPAAGAAPAARESDGQPAGHGRRVLALVVGAVGIAGVAAGAGLGLASKSSWNQSQTDCATPIACSGYAQAVHERSVALTYATASDVAFVAGGAVLAAAAILFFTAPSAPATTPAAASSAAATMPSILPDVGPRGGGVLLRGMF